MTEQPLTRRQLRELREQQTGFTEQEVGALEQPVLSRRELRERERLAQLAAEEVERSRVTDEAPVISAREEPANSAIPEQVEPTVPAPAHSVPEPVTLPRSIPEPTPAPEHALNLTFGGSAKSAPTAPSAAVSVPSAPPAPQQAQPVAGQDTTGALRLPPVAPQAQASVPMAKQQQVPKWESRQPQPQLPETWIAPSAPTNEPPAITAANFTPPIQLHAAEPLTHHSSDPFTKNAPIRTDADDYFHRLVMASRGEDTPTGAIVMPELMSLDLTDALNSTGQFQATRSVNVAPELSTTGLLRRDLESPALDASVDDVEDVQRMFGELGPIPARSAVSAQADLGLNMQPTNERRISLWIWIVLGAIGVTLVGSGVILWGLAQGWF